MSDDTETQRDSLAVALEADQRRRYGSPTMSMIGFQRTADAVIAAGWVSPAARDADLSAEVERFKAENERLRIGMDGAQGNTRRMRESLVAERDQLHADLARLTELAYDRHGELYRDRFRNQMDAATELLADLARRTTERDALAQAIHDGRGILGFDNDGDTEPHTGDYVQYAGFWVKDAEEERKDRDDAYAEHDADLARRDEVVADAWDEGCDHGNRGGVNEANPYRAALSTADADAGERG